MSRRPGRESAVAVYAIAVVAAVLAPALVVARTGAEGGAGDPGWPLDVLLVSVLIGIGYALVASRRLRRRAAGAESAANAWIAAMNALVALALFCTGFVTMALHELGGLRTDVADARGAVSALWCGCLLLAVAAAEALDRILFRWLSAAGPPSPAGSRQAGGAAAARLPDSRASRGG